MTGAAGEKVSRVGVSKVKPPWPVPLTMPRLAAHSMGAVYHTSASTSWKRLLLKSSSVGDARLYRVVTSMARVMGAFGSKAAPVPLIVPVMVAQYTSL